MKQIDILKSIVDPLLYESLNKSIVKLGTKSVVDITELHDALQIAPKSIIAFLMRELKDMEKDGAKEVPLPWDKNALMLINKRGDDVYAGHLARDGKVEHEFSLCSIPQLAAHLLSFSELYDESPGQQKESEASAEKSPEIDSLIAQLKIMDDKINALMMLVAGSKSNEIRELSKSEPPNIKKKFIDNVKSYGLKKAGLAPKMPKPPKPGSNVGGNNGITQAGIHGDKTSHTDSNTKMPTHETGNPFLKVPKPGDAIKQPKETKTKLNMSETVLTFKKSELLSACIDCGQAAGACACFKALSKPEIKKSDSSSITLKFRNDWDNESISALYKSIKRMKD